VLHLQVGPPEGWGRALADELPAGARHLLVLVLASVRENDLCALETQLDIARANASLQTVVIVPRRRERAWPAQGRPLPSGWRPRVCHVALRAALRVLVRDGIDAMVLGADIELVSEMSSTTAPVAALPRMAEAVHVAAR
jgi:alkylhydroperoxidase/carboxymuconolactone decarboxylase family protein YurZ